MRIRPTIRFKLYRVAGGTQAISFHLLVLLEVVLRCRVRAAACRLLLQQSGLRFSPFRVRYKFVLTSQPSLMPVQAVGVALRRAKELRSSLRNSQSISS